MENVHNPKKKINASEFANFGHFFVTDRDLFLLNFFFSFKMLGSMFIFEDNIYDKKIKP